MQTKRLLTSLAFALGLTLTILWLLAGGAVTPAYADDCTVTNTDASGTGSLRQALIDANANPGHDSISFSIEGAIVLTDALPAIGNDVTITGPGAAQLTVRGDNDYRVFSITKGTAVTISAVTVRDGNAVHGGGIWTAGNLHLTATHVLSSWVVYGGAVYVSEGSAALSETEIVDNRAALDGGGMYVGRSSATLNVREGRIGNNSAK